MAYMLFQRMGMPLFLRMAAYVAARNVVGWLVRPPLVVAVPVVGRAAYWAAAVASAGSSVLLVDRGSTGILYGCILGLRQLPYRPVCLRRAPPCGAAFAAPISVQHTHHLGLSIAMSQDATVIA